MTQAETTVARLRLALIVAAVIGAGAVAALVWLVVFNHPAAALGPSPSPTASASSTGSTQPTNSIASTSGANSSLAPTARPTAGTATATPSPTQAATVAPTTVPTAAPSPTPFQQAPADADYIIDAPAEVNGLTTLSQVISDPGDNIDRVTIRNLIPDAVYRIVVGQCGGVNTAALQWFGFSSTSHGCEQFQDGGGYSGLIVQIQTFTPNSYISYTLYVMRLS